MSNLSIKNMNQSDKQKPNTVDAVVDEIIAELTLEEKVGTANLGEDEYRVVELTLGKFIRHKLDQMDVDVNETLRDDCISRSERSTLDDADAAAVVLKEIWDRLKETHKLRVVK